LSLAGRTDRHRLVAGAEWGRFATFADPDGNGWVLTQSHGEAE